MRLTLTRATDSTPTPVTLARLAFYMLYFGLTCLDGPYATQQRMREHLVTRRGWLSAVDFDAAVAFAVVAPGPRALQLAVYGGGAMRGFRGAVLAALALALPSCAAVVGLALAYTLYGGHRWVHEGLQGAGAGVLGVLAGHAAHLARERFGRDRRLWAIAVVLGGISVVARDLAAAPLLLAVACVAAGGACRALATRTAVAQPLGWGLLSSPGAGGFMGGFALTTLAMLAGVCLLAGAFSFGAGLTALPFLYDGASTSQHWVNAQELLGALAAALLTPLSVLAASGSIGFLAAGFPGAALALAGALLPTCLLSAAAGSRARRRLPGPGPAWAGIAAAALGASAGTLLLLAMQALPGGATWVGRDAAHTFGPLPVAWGVLLLTSFALAWRFRRMPPALPVLAAAVLYSVAVAVLR